MFAARSTLAFVCVVALAVGCGSSAPPLVPAAQPGDRAQADAVRAAVRELMAGEHLRAVIVLVTVDGMAYLPSKKIAIAVAATYQPEAFDGAGLYSNSADTVFRRIGAILAPDEAPPTKR